MNDLSPKVTAAALGTATATILWTLIAALSPGVFTEAAIASLTGATATLVAGVLGFLVRDAKRESSQTRARTGGRRTSAKRA
jgi:hypothetical protein